MFHSISIDTCRQSSLRNLYVFPELFKEMMYWIRDWGYRGCTLREGLAILTNTKPLEKVIAITCDDVYKSALPTLNELGFSATCFFVAHALGSQQFGKWLPGEKRLMDANQVSEWHRMGMEVGSHTLTHQNLTKIGPREANRAIAESKAYLADLVGAEVTYFAYPFGSFNQEISNWVRVAGYLGAVTTKPRRARAADDCYAYPRLGVAVEQSRRTWILKLFTSLGDCRCELRYTLIDSIKLRVRSFIR